MNRAEATTNPSSLDSNPTLRPSLGRDATVNGKLSFTQPTRLDGTLRGEVRSTSLLVIGETGRVEGAVSAQSLIVQGRVWADVVQADRVEVAPGGFLEGKVETSTLIVQDGGRFEGDCVIRPPARTTVIRLATARDENSNERT